MKKTTAKKIWLTLSVVIGLTLVLSIWKAETIKNYFTIQSGNELVQKLEDYKLENSRIPNNKEFDILKGLDFKITPSGTEPVYKKLDKWNYRITYRKYVKGPALTYSSLTKKWVVE